MSTDDLETKDRVTIVLHSGAYDRACYALCTAMAALASEMEVHILLTFEGLRRFTKGHLEDLGDETPPTVRADIEWGLESGAIQPLGQQLAEVRKMGIKIYACPNAMASLNISLRDLLEVDQVMGLVAFLALARTAKVNLYI